eukprot:3288535-Pleurochrysis_carterae.AAC.1
MTTVGTGGTSTSCPFARSRSAATALHELRLLALGVDARREERVDGGNIATWSPRCSRLLAGLVPGPHPRDAR